MPKFNHFLLHDLTEHHMWAFQSGLLTFHTYETYAIPRYHLSSNISSCPEYKIYGKEKKGISFAFNVQFFTMNTLHWPPSWIKLARLKATIGEGRRTQRVLACTFFHQWRHVISIYIKVCTSRWLTGSSYIKHHFNSRVYQFSPGTTQNNRPFIEYANCKAKWVKPFCKGLLVAWRIRVMYVCPSEQNALECHLGLHWFSESMIWSLWTQIPRLLVNTNFTELSCRLWCVYVSDFGYGYAFTAADRK